MFSNYLDISFISETSSKENKSILEVTRENIDIIKNNVFDIKERFEFKGKRPSDAIYNYFNEIGGYAISPNLGKVELSFKGAKSTAVHKISELKANAVPAIKNVIENGSEISFVENYSNDGIDRYIYSGKGKILGADCVVSVAIKSYPHAKNEAPKFYIHNAMIIENEANLLKQTGSLESDKPVSKFTSNNIISDFSLKSNTIEGKKSVDDTIYDFKEKQNRIIQQSNPIDDDYHTWIRNAGDIKTFEETLSDSDYNEGEDFDPSYSWDMAQKALKSGKITVYSSYPISQGVFVTPSKMEAEDYAGGGRIFKKTVNLTDVAWIDPTQGQFAKVDGDENIKHNDLRFAVDDEITDDLFSFDGDLFEDDNTKYLDEYIKTSPQEAVLSMYNSLAKTGESVVRGFKGVKLDEGNYIKAARRLMKHYQIKQKSLCEFSPNMSFRLSGAHGEIPF